VAALSSSNVWAVGEEFNQDPYGYGALIEHWNGTRWKAVPNPATRTMYGITANSPTDVWAAGETQILHWDGSAWGVVQSPQPQGGGDYQLRAVAAASADDIWAAGYALVPSGEGYAYQNLIEHWNGASWGLASGVGLNPGSDLLFGISAASPTRVWAVGTSGGHSFVERWDGATWAHVASPNRGTSNNTLRSIAAIRDTGDVWTVGQFYRAVSPYQSRTLVETCSACGS
jgi:hypothetical protein